MARITKADNAPQGVESASLGAETITLPYDTDDPVLLSNARANPFLVVEEDAVEASSVQRIVTDPNDPHENVAADHLATSGSQESRDAADANEATIREAAGLEVPADRTGDPTVAESLGATFDSVGADGEPELPNVEVEQSREATTAQTPEARAPVRPTVSHVATDSGGDES